MFCFCTKRWYGTVYRAENSMTQKRSYMFFLCATCGTKTRGGHIRRQTKAEQQLLLGILYKDKVFFAASIKSELTAGTTKTQTRISSSKGTVPPELYYRHSLCHLIYKERSN